MISLLVDWTWLRKKKKNYVSDMSVETSKTEKSKKNTEKILIFKNYGTTIKDVTYM